MAVEPVARWDPPAAGGDPQSPHEALAAPQPDAPPAERDLRAPKRDPASPPRDSAAAALDPKVRRRDPAEGGDPLVAEGGPAAECWRPGSAPAGRPRRPPARTRLRNRRYAALRRLIQAGEYFSEEEMRAREPLLYQHYIGQYQEGGGGSGDPCPGDLPSPCAPPRLAGPPLHPLTGLLLRSVEEAAVQQRLRRQRLRDGDSEEDEEEEPWVPDEAERALLREEFTSRMYQRFLDGEDGDFDYSQIDEDPDLDNLDIVSRDAEERYFDEEEPSDAPQLD